MFKALPIVLLALAGILAPAGVRAQGQIELAMPPALAEARTRWLAGRYDGIWDVIRRAAEDGHPVAQNMLGVSLTDPEGAQGLPYDPAAAHGWYLKAADQGFARAHFNLAIFWQKDHPGFGIDPDKSRARAEEAIALGYPHANTVIGDLYKTGLVGPADPARAFEYYRRAADGGAFNGYRMTGYAYLNGEGVEKDAELGALYLERAVRAGDSVPLRDLAFLYEGNEGVPQDLVKAYLLYRLGVERGRADAAYELGLFVAYEEYAGFWHDPVRGYGYCLLALDRGFTLEDGGAEAECAALADGFDAVERAAARAFADGLR